MRTLLGSAGIGVGALAGVTEQSHTEYEAVAPSSSVEQKEEKP